MNNDFKKSFINGIAGFLGVSIIPLIFFISYRSSTRVRVFMLQIFNPEKLTFERCQGEAFQDWKIELWGGGNESFEKWNRISKKYISSKDKEKAYREIILDPEFVSFRKTLCGK